jgi:hypothetical protein
LAGCVAAACVHLRGRCTGAPCAMGSIMVVLGLPCMVNYGAKRIVCLRFVSSCNGRFMPSFPACYCGAPVQWLAAARCCCCCLRLSHGVMQPSTQSVHLLALRVQHPEACRIKHCAKACGQVGIRVAELVVCACYAHQHCMGAQCCPDPGRVVGICTPC